MLETTKVALGKLFCGGVVLLCLSGCVSYVNIPADLGDSAFNAVNVPPVPGVMASALAYASNQYPTEGAVAIALPAPSGTRTFEVSMKKVGAGAAPWAGSDDVRATYRVLSVRVRGSSAIVDVLLPYSLELLDGKYLLEINLAGHLNGWSVIGVKRFVPTAERMALAAVPMGVGQTVRIGEEFPEEDAASRAISASAGADEPAEGSKESATFGDDDGGTTADPEKIIEEQKIENADEPLRPIRSVPPPKKDGGVSSDLPATGVSMGFQFH